MRVKKCLRVAKKDKGMSRIRKLREGESFRIPVKLSLKSLDSEASTRVLDVRVEGVLQVLSSNTEARANIANTITGNTEINRLRYPVRRHALRESSLETPSAGSRLTTVTVNVASEVRLVFRVTDQNDTLNSVESSTRELGESVASSSSTLRVTFKDEARVWVGSEGVFDLGDDSGGTLGGVLVETGRIDCVVLDTTTDGGADFLVHGAEAGGWALEFTGTTGVDDGIGGASSSFDEGEGLDSASGGEEEADEGGFGKHFE